MKNFQAQYVKLLTDINSHGVFETNERTGHEIGFLPQGALLTMDMANWELPVPGIRKVFPKSAAAEIAWFLQGLRNVDFIQGYAPLWDKFVEEDGHTIHAAYGYRWRHHFGRDQIAKAIDAINKNPSDRQVVVSAWDPKEDGLGSSRAKNVPCPILFQLFAHQVRGIQRLNMAVYMRSSDVFVGLPYDVLSHSLLLFAFVNEFQNKGKMLWQPGFLQFHLAHPHLYDSHISDSFQALANYKEEIAEPRMPSMFSVSGIAESPEAYIFEVAVIQQKMDQPKFNVRPEVIL